MVRSARERSCAVCDATLCHLLWQQQIQKEEAGSEQESIPIMSLFSPV